ncbi:uncharacterized protein LOC119676833 [Teleopsis dalmanni]|uniref:uncharacterized protein LOC119676833 n=1 Tax=Teleopsis dalmanni TaxID=139649 RepID=UPI0018CFEA86|nr:uncharacterized protein LOC119676833 [Teleopsis dalmanni]
MLAENNVLLKKNLGLHLVQWAQKFPLKTYEEIIFINEELQGDRKLEIIESMKKILSGNVANIEAIFSKSIILSHNCGGVKGKTSLREYPFLLDAIFESTRNGKSFNDFIGDLRSALRLAKNRLNKQNFRAKGREMTSTIDDRIKGNLEIPHFK